MTDPTTRQQAVLQVVTSFLGDNAIEFEQPTPTTFAAVLPGEFRLRTTLSIVVGDHGVSFNAFVIRHPDENHEALYRWLLERNSRLYGVAFALDHYGDVYLTGRCSLETVTPQELDRVFGSVLQNSDGAFNQLLEIGFESAIRREWAWRLERGESTANLTAFSHLAEPSTGREA